MECTPNKLYVCKLCDKEYSSRQNLWKHNNKFHTSVDGTKSSKSLVINGNKKEITENKKEITEDNIKCKTCNKKFILLTDLDKHMKLDCKPDVKHNNVFKFKIDTFGKNKYKEDK